MKRRKRNLHKLRPKRRATFERIRKLRERIGRIPMDLLQALRDLRKGR